jgi:hypothetical protein
MRWVVRLKDEEGYELVNLQTACSAMVRIAKSAMNGSGGVPVMQPTRAQQPDAAAAHTEFTVNT